MSWLREERNARNVLVFTNSVLCMKENTSSKKQSMSDNITNKCIRNCTLTFTKKLIEIIKLKIIITVGKEAFSAIDMIYNICDAYNIKNNNSFKLVDVLNSKDKPFKVENSPLIFPVAHPSHNWINRPEPLYSQDWMIIKQYID